MTTRFTICCVYIVVGGTVVLQGQVDPIYDLMLEARIAHELSYIDATHLAPVEARLASVAKEEGLSPQDMERYLFSVVRNRIQASDGGVIGASTALSVLGRTGNAELLPALLEVARSPLFNTTAAEAALRIATRSAPPGYIPKVVHQLSEVTDLSTLYAIVADILQHRLPDEIGERATRREQLLNVLKDGLLNPGFDNRMYLDAKLEKLDPSFIASPERKELLRELRNSRNERERAYAEETLQRVFGVSGALDLAESGLSKELTESLGGGPARKQASIAAAETRELRLLTLIGAASLVIVASSIWYKRRRRTNSE